MSCVTSPPFQSTHPLRGATARTSCACARTRSISIHAPLAGCDQAFPSPAPLSPAFQSTHPLRGATRADKGRGTGAAFQSTHPLRGATRVSVKRADLIKISIHAPLAGCDDPARGRHRSDQDFNPRTPCGVRRPRWPGVHHRWHFNPRTPCGVRPSIMWVLSSVCPYFNPRTPCGVRLCAPMISLPISISIHAPLAGCDTASINLTTQYQHFNPRTPCGVRQQKRTKKTALFLN